MPEEERFSPEDTHLLVESIMPPQIAEIFEKHHEADFAYSVAGVGRFRVNAYFQRSSVAIALRRVRPTPGSAEELGLPPVLFELAYEQRGLVLVTGPTGSGKTTTLASMIDHINQTRPCHIVTIEDPIEYLHRDNLAAVDQREVGFDTDTFESAMRVVLRQDPDVILVGEMRDPETAPPALTAAETGHLVLTTLHTIDATETDQPGRRLLPALPAVPDPGLARRGAAGDHRPAPGPPGRRQGPAAGARDHGGQRPHPQCIARPRADRRIEQIIADGEYYGMQTFDQSLAQLSRRGTITLQEALQVPPTRTTCGSCSSAAGWWPLATAGNPAASGPGPERLTAWPIARAAATSSTSNRPSRPPGAPPPGRRSGASVGVHEARRSPLAPGPPPRTAPPGQGHPGAQAGHTRTHPPANRPPPQPAADQPRAAGCECRPG